MPHAQDVLALLLEQAARGSSAFLPHSLSDLLLSEGYNVHRATLLMPNSFSCRRRAPSTDQDPFLTQLCLPRRRSPGHPPGIQKMSCMCKFCY